MSADTNPTDPLDPDDEDSFSKADDTLTAEMFPDAPPATTTEPAPDKPPPPEPMPADPVPADPVPADPAPVAAPARPTADPKAKSDGAYRVLARKYRPTNFDTLIGQESLVRTLTNAMKAGRIAQAFILTGVRGVGKTTTARIVAKALNCVGPDGKGGPTAAPCGVCANCTAIAEDRHVDVLEMDAASRTGVDDIRELIDGVRYRPVSARFKVYILDEVHMLSKNAFNALLKTLEEPPEHMTFIFATTEIRKVPVTILSRCQRFDLRRVPAEKLIAHYAGIAEQENVTVEPEALAMIARAADGSVRDGLSILDQAIALSDGPVTAERVRDMLGLANRERIYDLFEAVMAGEAATALDIVGRLYDGGADPVVVIQDLMEVCHWSTRSKLVPGLAEDPTTPELERTRGAPLAARLSMASLARAWQLLMKGLGEVQNAPSPIQAAEMVLIRLLHVSDLPTPGDLVKKLAEAGTNVPTSAPPAESAAPSPSTPAAAAAPVTAATPAPSADAPTASIASGAVPNATAAAQPARAEAPPEEPNPSSFGGVLALLEKRREAIVLSHLKRNVHLVRFETGRIDIRPTDDAPKNIHGRLGELLTAWTGNRWIVSISNEPGEPTVAERERQARQARHNRAERDPLVQAVKQAFPSARVVQVRNLDDDTVDPIQNDDPDGEAAGSDDGPPVDPEDPGFDPDFLPN